MKNSKHIILIKFNVKSDIELRIVDPKYAKEHFSQVDKNRAYLRQWLPWLDNTQKDEDILTFYNQGLERFEKDIGLELITFCQQKLVGGIGFNTIDFHHRKASIGYWLAESYQGKGIITESCRTLINYAFNDLKLNRIEIRCATGNHKSRKIPQKLGFKEEGILRQNEWLYDHYIDHVVYSILSTEWKNQKTG